MTSPHKHDFTATPSEVLRYFLVCLRGFHKDREKSKAADWATVGLKEPQRSTNAAITNSQMDERAWFELDGKPKVVQSRKVEGQAILGPSQQVIFSCQPLCVGS
jgi:hypothetical protein